MCRFFLFQIYQLNQKRIVMASMTPLFRALPTALTSIDMRYFSCSSVIPRWESVIGIEVHAQLKCRTKLLSPIPSPSEVEGPASYFFFFYFDFSLSSVDDVLQGGLRCEQTKHTRWVYVRSTLNCLLSLVSLQRSMAIH